VTDGDSAVYVYGILRASDAAAVSVEGVSGAPVRVIAHGDVAALVSDLDSDTLSAAREVRAHWRVLEEAARDATVLPVRFGTVMERDGAVREGVLARNEQQIGALLSELAGRVQLTVKGTYDEPSLLREVVAQSPQIAALRERTRSVSEQAGYYDQIRLGEMVAGEIARRRDHDARLALDLLEPLAVAALAQPVTGADAAFDLAFLVERDAIDAFSAAVVKLGEQVGDRIAIRYVGPLPPYSFADHEVATGSAAWA
jgi:hypothetical protein